MACRAARPLADAAAIARAAVIRALLRDASAKHGRASIRKRGLQKGYGPLPRFCVHLAVENAHQVGFANGTTTNAPERGLHGRTTIMTTYARIPFALAALAATAFVPAQAQQPAAPAAAPVKLGIVSFLTG